MCGVMAVMAAGAVMSAVAGMQAAKVQRETGRANQAIAENNAVLAEQQAKDSAILASREQQKSAWRTRAKIGRQKAAIAANGLDMDIGTPLDILGETAMFGGAERSAIAADAARKAWGFESEALNYRNQGAQAAWAGKAGSKATILKSIGSGLSQGGSAWANYGGGG